jgi:hypothetical protein
MMRDRPAQNEEAQMACLRYRTLLGLGMLALAACGGGGGGGGAKPNPTVTVAPSPFELHYQGAALQFSATVTGVSSSAVSWSLYQYFPNQSPLPLLGGISKSGLLVAYTQCNQGYSPGEQLQVKATSAAGSNLFGTSLGVIAIAPPMFTPFTMPTGTSAYFQPGDPCGSGLPGYDWAIEEGAAGGTVSARAFAGQGQPAIYYTSPANAGTYHLDVKRLGGKNTGAIIVQQPMAAGASLSACRTGHTATLLADGTVFVVGSGMDPDGGENIYNLGTCGYTQQSSVPAQSTAEIYSPAAASFTAAAPPAYSSMGGQSATLLADGRVLLTGGIAPPHGTGTYASAEIYDPATKTFTATGNMNVARANHVSALLSNGKVLVTGGAPNASAELYDPKSGVFTAIASPPLAANRFYGTATVLANGQVLIAGGCDCVYVPATGGVTDALLSAEIYDPVANSFSATGSLQSGHMNHTATLLPNGSVLIVGGLSSVAENISGAFPQIAVGTVSATAEIYAPASRQFTTTASAPKLPRAFHAATLLANGAVLISGGLTQWPNLDMFATVFTAVPVFAYQTETYDPGTGAFATGALTPARVGLTATRLQDNSVVLIGGGPLPISLYP